MRMTKCLQSKHHNDVLHLHLRQNPVRQTESLVVDEPGERSSVIVRPRLDSHMIEQCHARGRVVLVSRVYKVVRLLRNIDNARGVGFFECFDEQSSAGCQRGA